MSSRALDFTLITSGLVILPSARLAQDDKGQKEGMKQDLPEAGTQTAGRRLAGTWNVAVKYIMGEKEHEGKATCEAKLILGSRFLQQEYTSRFHGEPFHVLQLLPGTTTPERNRSRSCSTTWSTSVRHNEGTVSDDGKVFTNSERSGSIPRPESRTSCAPKCDDHRRGQLHPGVVPF